MYNDELSATTMYVIVLSVPSNVDMHAKLFHFC